MLTLPEAIFQVLSAHPAICLTRHMLSTTLIMGIHKLGTLPPVSLSLGRSPDHWRDQRVYYEVDDHGRL